MIAPLLPLVLLAQTVVFENVNVVPMDRERILERQTVIVTDGRITQLGPASKVKAPAGAQRIAATGKYLMPGLAEMHGHLPGPNTPQGFTDTVLFLYIANGVTTVRGMLGSPANLETRAAIASGQQLGPRMYVAGPAFSGQSATSPEQARQMVRDQKAAGYDHLKIQEGLRRDVYDAIVAAAGEAGIRFAGHVPNDVGVERAIEARQVSIDHLDGYLEALEPGDSPIRNAEAMARAAQLYGHLDERKIAGLAKATRQAGVWVAPTMALWESFFSDESGEALRARMPELKYLPKSMVDGWVQGKTGMLAKGNIMGFKPGGPSGAKVIELRRKMLKALRDAGAGILLGTDSPQLFSVPGFSIHREMQSMIGAGLSPYEVLASGTRRVAEYFGTTKETGTVTLGQRADLILLESNPLSDVANVARRAGVMVRGRWLPESEIQERLAKIAAGG